MSAAMTILDWHTLPLTMPDRVLIEASAGTGKTWTIAALYLRLLLDGEKPATVERILVATFTEAAARELRERLWMRLADAERVLQRITNGTPIPVGANIECDAVLEWLVAKFSDAQAAKPALRRIELARIDFDRAPIGTIHSLCQRFLRDFPLHSGMAAAAQEFLDETALLRECVEDFWRRRYFSDGPVDSAEQVLFDEGPDGLLGDLRGLLAHGDPVLEPNGLDALDAAVACFREPGKLRELEELCDSKHYKLPARSAVRNRLSTIHAALETGGEVFEVLENEVDKYFTDDELDKQQSASAKPRLRDHALIHELRELAFIAKRRRDFVRGRVLGAALGFCRTEMPRRAAQRQGLTFPMLIGNVHARLGDAHDGFAQALFDAFPYALVDEFQDTDTRQFEIFDAIYRGAGADLRGWLAMIGDPKQAIYGFRGGDIAAYLRARDSAGLRYAMDTNYRSSRALIEAMNALYGASDFGDPRIVYQRMECGGKAEEIALRRDRKSASPLHLHVIPGVPNARKKEAIAQGKTESAVLDDCTGRIVELLNGSDVTLGGKPVQPGDIAVLVPTNAQGAQVRKRLVARGVPCAGSRESVFAGEVAQELELFLAAVLHPDDDGAVRGALATRLLGCDLRTILALQTDFAGFEFELDRFAGWHELARTRGLFGATADLLAQRAGTLLELPDGAGIVADLRHLGELIAQRESLEPGAEAAIAWFAQMRREGAGDDERGQRVRVLGEGNAVRILTLHAAKGLEFPIVFLPLVWRVSERSGKHRPRVLRFHDAEGRVCIDIGSEGFGSNLGRHFAEDLRERQRLLYVAMTRAQSALHVYWVDCKVQPDAAEWEVPAIDILLRQAQEVRGLACGAATMPALVDKIESMVVIGPFAGAGAKYVAASAAPTDFSPHAPLPALRRFEWLHSFSAITRLRVAEDVDAAAADESEVSTPDVEAASVESEHPELLALDAWRGRRFGDAVHQTLEDAGMRPVERAALSGRLTAQGIDLRSPDAQDALLRMLERVRSTDLGGGLRLMDLPAHGRVAEFGFQFPVDATLGDLRAACTAHGFPDVWPAHLRASELNGMLAGFADLIFAFGGRYHVLDYKTNRLGARLSDYVGASLNAAMDEHHYPLQALLYTVALHRYLRGRMRDYSPELHLGDSVYLFLRGVGLAPCAGIWRRRWPAKLILDLDDVFAGAEVAA